MRVAAIDLGTNTVRLLVGEADGRGGYRPVFATQAITRLGEGLQGNGQLQPEPIRRTLAVLARYREEAERRSAARIAVVGTSAVRRARNREAFLAQARRETGLEVRVISGEEEARLSLLGVRAAIRLGERPFVMMDIGGGSTELVLADGRGIRASVSTGLGVVVLTEAHLATDPPSPQELEALRETALAELIRQRTAGLRAPDVPRGVDPPCLVGTAGTVTTLAAIDLGLGTYDPDRVNGHRLPRARVADLATMLAGLTLSQRRQVRGLEPQRADVIVAGAIVTLAAMDALGFPEMTVSDGGLREGILLDLLGRDEAPRPNDSLPPAGQDH
jgi:exopolyphosphatase/guanosine-5'-triphosphate,3'-diphosphate pyrophosphatase